MRRRLRWLGPLALVIGLSAACDDEPHVDGDQIRTRCLAAADAAPDTFVLGGSWAGVCDGAGRCAESLRIESSCLTYQALDEDGEILQLNHAILTERGIAEAQTRAAALVGVVLPPLFDACGEGECQEAMIGLAREGDAETFEWRGAPAMELAEVADFLEWIRLSVRACARGEWMTIDEGCERL